MEQFIIDLKDLCEKHQFVINWDEYREEFCVEKINKDKFNLKCLINAYNGTNEVTT